MKKISKWLAGLLAATLVWAPIPVIAEDIDIFTGGSMSASNPSILFVLDNTSNWARQSQQWPGGDQQGQSEANAIKTLLTDSSVVNTGVNLGLFEFVTEGNANNSGGFVRYPISQMTADNKAAFSAKLTTIYNGVNAVTEKRNSNTEYGWLLNDVYNYLTGSAPHDSPLNPNPDAATAGYTTPYTMFKSPITQANGCGRIFMVFIGNPNSSGPADDSDANKTALGQIPLSGGQYCSTTNVSLPNFTDSVTGGTHVDLGYSLTCSTSAGCVTTDYAACSDGTYESCACNATNFVSSLACAAGTQRYMSTQTTVTTPTATLGTSSDCKASCDTATAEFAACSDGTYPGGCSCPSSVNTCPSGTQRYTVVETASGGSTTVLGDTSKCKTSAAAFPGSDEAYFDFPTCLAVENQCSVIAAPTTAGPCPTGAARYLMQDVASTTSTVGATDACYSSAPAASTTSLADTCSGTGVSCASPAATGTTGSCAAGTQRYMVQNSLVNGATSTVGPTAACYSAAPGSVPPDMTAVCSAGTCSAPAATTTSGSCPAGTQRYMVTNSVTTADVNLTSVTGQASVCAASTPSSATVTQKATASSGGVTTSYSNYRWNRTNSNCSPNVGGSKLYEPLADSTVATDQGYSINCAANAGTALTTGYTANGVSGTNTSTGALSCPGATKAYNYTLTSPLLTNKGYTLACYASSGAAATTGYAANVGAGNSLSINAANTSTAALACSGGNITGSYSAYNYTKTASTSIDKGYTLSCYTSPPSAGAGSVGYTFANTPTVSTTISTGTLACNAIGPSYRASTIQNVTTATVNTTLGTTTACTASAPTTFPDFPTCASGPGITCNATTSTNSCPSGKSTYTVLGTGATISTTVDLGYTNTCTATAGAASATDVTPAPTCSGTGISCAIDAARSTTTAASGSCAANRYRFMVEGTTPSTTTSVPTGTYSSASNMYMADEWARCLHQGDLSPDGAAAVAEAFTADFNTSGTIAGADTITFDGVTVTLAGGETPDQIAAKVADGVYNNWVATKSASGIVTFSRTIAGAYGDVTAGDFNIVNVVAGTETTKPEVVVTTTTQGADATGGAVGKQNVTTYTIDVYNAQQNSTHTALMMSMAQQGGGRYFAAKSEAEILTALKQIMSEIQSVNTAFAAASIPLSTTNRSQNLNEVYIGVFRPSLEPRWFGNLKKFKIAKTNGILDLVDSLGTTALNSQTGFLNDCAVSFWTTDSGVWWDQVKIGATNLSANTLINPVPSSTCVAMPAANTSVWSDLPDGQSVEKGAVAEVIRRGNNPPTTATTPTWAVNRTIYTRSGSSLTPLTQALAGGSADLYNYIRGVDINVDGSHVEEKTLATAIANAVRPSVHGDVVHSRPLAVNYGTNDTVIYYGANDGMWRAVDGLTGKEKWAFIPAEFLDVTKQTRLMGDTPYVAFGAAPAVGSTPKDYMFDGSAGLYQSLNNTKVWLFPTQRRGGRMVHALDVTTSATPTLKWYQGCPNLGDDTGCTSGFDGIGQTWSVPVVTKIKGYSTTRPVVIFGGGYDDCEDVTPATNTSAAVATTWTNGSGTGACETAKGRAVYVVDAEDGSLLKTFTFTGLRGITAGVSFVDIDNDGYADYGYVADLGGTIYRLSFVNSPVVTTPLAASDWTMKKIAYTNGRRKFMFSPAVTYGGKTTVSGTDIYSVYVALGSGDRERPLAEDYPYLADYIDPTGATTTRNQLYGYRDTLEAYGNVAKAEKFTADFSTSGAIDGADAITFDGVTTTLVGGETPPQIAAAIAAQAYPTWTAANTFGSAVVTFTRKTTGEQADITPAAFAIVDTNSDGSMPVVLVSKLIDGADAALAACNLDGDAAASDACVLDYTTAPATCSSPGILPTEAKKAWRVGFVYQGEQAVTQTVILGGMAIVNTTRPVPAGVCSAALGEGGGYFVNLLTGSGAIGVEGSCGGELRGSFKGVGLPTDPVIVNLPGEDPILIGSVDKTNTNPSIGSKLFQPTAVPPPISKVKSRKYRYTVVD